MGRTEKLVVSPRGIDRRELGYYSTPDFISRFMTRTMLTINPGGTSALDPCVGKEEMIKPLFDAGITIDGIDVHDHGDHFYCNFTNEDFIDRYRKIKTAAANSAINLKYDYYIANPPYNCHEVDYIRKNKQGLTTLFESVGVRNMYSMFISAIIDCAKEGSVIAIIASDSFLTAKTHAALRTQIITQCALHYLILCPSDLFRDQKADVRTCLLILQKGPAYQGKVKVLNRPSDSRALETKLDRSDFLYKDLDQLLVKDSRNSRRFVVDVPEEVQALFNNPALGEVFTCVTGISTGNDARFIAAEQRSGFEIPFYKNPGSRKFFCQCDGYLSNDYLMHAKEVKTFLVRNKSLMMKEGITCSSMGFPFGACYLPSGATFGVNANIFADNKDDLWWLLAYLNSSLVTYFVRAVVIRSNMVTSGYVSKVPIIPLTAEAKQRLAEIARIAYNTKLVGNDVLRSIADVDNIVFNEAHLPQHVREEVRNFAINVQVRA